MPAGGSEEVQVLTRGQLGDVDGMFALASLDRMGSLRLLRDRFGIKPLFIREESGDVAFASELPALMAEVGPLEVDRDAVHEILALGRTVDRRTIYSGLRELPPLARAGQDFAPAQSPDDIRDAVRDAVRRTLVSDRPVGLALSGGLDSSIIAHELHDLGVRGLQTVSLALHDHGDGVNEVSSAAFINEKYYEANGWDADAPGSAVGEDYISLPVVVSKTNGGAFDFFGIKLTGVYNDGNAYGPVDFTFTHANGATDPKSVSLNRGVIGFQSFGFNETNLTSFTFTPSATAYALQFDYVNVADSVSAVPLPASLPMFGGALLALASFGFGLNRRNAKA